MHTYLKRGRMSAGVEHVGGLVGADGSREGEEQGHIGSGLSTQRARLAVEGRVEAEAVAAGGEHVGLLVQLDAVSYHQNSNSNNNNKNNNHHDYNKNDTKYEYNRDENIGMQ
jgi:hypothetical protein